MTHKFIYPLFTCLLVLAALGMSLALYSCNASEEEVENDSYLAAASVAVTNFHLSPDIRVMRNLDSVFFSIDLEHGVIFNADSLPKGTNVGKLTPKITYPQSVSSAIIEMKGGSHREDSSFDYARTPTDTVDFTGNVTLTLSTADNKITKTYSIKVNVHQEDPDTLYWDNLASMNLPSRLPDPLNQRSVAYGSGVLSLILENDNSYTLATSSDVFEGRWTKKALSLSFTPNVRSMAAAADGTLYMLSEDGDLYTSADGSEWSRLDSGWDEIIGTFGDVLLGTGRNEYAGLMLSWPRDSYPEIELPEGFPATGFSNPIVFSNRWTSDPTIVIFGGESSLSDGNSASWAFDGSQWVNIAESPLPALSGISVVSYYSYLKSATSGLLKEFEVYLAFGGKDSKGNVNRTVFISYDRGIQWQKAQEFSQLPDFISAGYSLDAISLGTEMQSNLSDRWKSQSRRKLPFQIDGDLVRWECPYIFLFGGFDNTDKLIPEIRSGVLQRLTFTPLF